MILKTNTTIGKLESIKITDEIELVIYDVNNTKKMIKLLVKVVDFLKEPERCHYCQVALKGEDKTEYAGVVCCQYCKKRRAEEFSKTRGHKPPDKFFGQMRK